MTCRLLRTVTRLLKRTPATVRGPSGRWSPFSIYRAVSATPTSEFTPISRRGYSVLTTEAAVDPSRKAAHSSNEASLDPSSEVSVDPASEADMNLSCEFVDPSTEGEDTSRQNSEPEGVKRIKYNCSGCGAVLQSTNPKLRGFIPGAKMKEWLQLVDDPVKALNEPNEMSAEEETNESESIVTKESDGVEDDEEGSSDVEDFFPDSIEEGGHIPPAFKASSFICQRCFSLKHYNDALNITLTKDDYLQHLSSLADKKALIILMLDVADFPGCIFPDLKNLLSENSSVLIVANKIDLFPRDLTNSFWSRFRTHIVDTCREISLGEHKIVGLRFVSVKNGSGVLELSEELVRKWGSRGDIYLLGCTNVGKSSLFNKLLLHLCGSKPGELNAASNLLAPTATISRWPGTTLNLLSFPLMSFGKRHRLLEQQRRREQEISLGIKKFEEYYDEKDDFSTAANKQQEELARFEQDLSDKKDLGLVELEDVLGELGLRRKKKEIVVEEQEPPQNKYWLHDTPGAINDAQLINYLTPKELTLGLPKVPLKPKTYILRPGQSLFLGGLARLDYLQGSVSAYFTVFTWSYLHVHATKLENADQLYSRQLGSPESIFKLPLSTDERGTPFPPLGHQDITLSGAGWKKSAADVILSSTGWVGVTFGGEEKVLLRAHTPRGKGIYVRSPSLFDEAVNQRGKREKGGNRTAFRGFSKKRK